MLFNHLIDTTPGPPPRHHEKESSQDRVLMQVKCSKRRETTSGAASPQIGKYPYMWHPTNATILDQGGVPQPYVPKT